MEETTKESVFGDLCVWDFDGLLQELVEPIFAVTGLFKALHSTETEINDDALLYLSVLTSIAEGAVWNNFQLLEDRIKKDLGEIKLQCPGHASIPFWLGRTKDKRPEFSAKFLFNPTARA
jgi:hypothetical protein